MTNVAVINLICAKKAPEIVTTEVCPGRITATTGEYLVDCFCSAY